MIALVWFGHDLRSHLLQSAEDQSQLGVCLPDHRNQTNRRADLARQLYGLRSRILRRDLQARTPCKSLRTKSVTYLVGLNRNGPGGAGAPRPMKIRVSFESGSLDRSRERRDQAILRLMQPNKRPPLSSMNPQGRRGDPRWVTATLEPSVGARRNRSDLFPRGRGWMCSPPTTQR
jgi:hypothetical protein